MFLRDELRCVRWGETGWNEGERETKMMGVEIFLCGEYICNEVGGGSFGGEDGGEMMCVAGLEKEDGEGEALSWNCAAVGFGRGGGFLDVIIWRWVE